MPKIIFFFFSAHKKVKIELFITFHYIESMRYKYKYMFHSVGDMLLGADDIDDDD